MGKTPEVFLWDPDNIRVQIQDVSYCGGAGPLQPVHLQGSVSPEDITLWRGGHTLQIEVAEFARNELMLVACVLLLLTTIREAREGSAP